MAAVTKHGVRTASPSLLGQELQRQIANAFVLFGNYKHYHWQTYGPLFRDLHVLFDQFAKEALVNVDHFAERIHVIGADLLGHPIAATGLANVPLAATHSTMRDMVEEAVRNVIVVVAELREAARIAAEQDDHATAQRITQAVRVYEQHKWWLRDVLNKREGPYLV